MIEQSLVIGRGEPRDLDHMATQGLILQGGEDLPVVPAALADHHEFWGLPAQTRDQPAPDAQKE